jgi:carbonic anhydrase
MTFSNISRLFSSGRALLVLLFLATPFQAQETTAPLDNLKRLLDGNQRFVTGKLNPKDYLAERVKLAEGQHPYAIVVTCADSRLSPEILFDESLGKLFVIRTAGHVVDPVVLGSIEYAAEHLHVNVVFFLGHESCGAVKAAIAGGEFPPNIAALTSRIRPAVDKAISRGTADKDLLNAAIAENVQYQISLALFQSDPLKHLIDEHKVLMAGGVYSLRTGKVQIVEPGALMTRNEGPREATEESAKPANGSRPRAATSEEPTSEPTRKKVGFEETLRQAFEEKLEVRLQKPMLMRNGHDRCYFDDCRNIPAGEEVKLESPAILNVMGRKQVRVTYKGKHVYLVADPGAFMVLESASK